MTERITCARCGNANWISTVNCLACDNQIQDAETADLRGRLELSRKFLINDRINRQYHDDMCRTHVRNINEYKRALYLKGEKE